MTERNDFEGLHKKGFDDLNAFWEQLEALERRVVDVSEAAPSFLHEQVDRLEERLQAFEPAVSVIGQIKAGKSSLINALVGRPDLLPSDVNPWTSVITSLHLNSRNRPTGTRALFRFFDSEEWNRLVESGGRLGEMAQRAGFDDELSAVREQVEKMRQTTEQRLGAEFNELLGASRAFPELDKSILDRFICYSDPDDVESGQEEGVYADLTKQADLFVDVEGLPKGICIRDTPGVNDTFMMREQITLNAISESRMCIVVLSAHQALSTVDMALMRIICSVEAREVVIFVNRIDELSDPANECEQIEANIRKTLSRFGLEGDLEILFGSGYWANAALSDTCDAMMPASLETLENFVPGDARSLRARALRASGIEHLHHAIARRVIEGPGQTLIEDVEAELNKIAEMQNTVQTMAPGGDAVTVTPIEMAKKLSILRNETLAEFDAETKKIKRSLRERLNRSKLQFIDSAVDALQSHLDSFGEVDNWTHEPSSLRMTLRSAYTSAANRLRRTGERALESVADGVGEIMTDDLNLYVDSATADLPRQPQHRAPTALAKTLSLDLQGGWWRRFWRFGMKGRAEKRYRTVIAAEVEPLIEELLDQYFAEAIEQSRACVTTYFEDQTRFVYAVLEGASDAPEAAVAESQVSAPSEQQCAGTETSQTNPESNKAEEGKAERKIVAQLMQTITANKRSAA